MVIVQMGQNIVRYFPDRKFALFKRVVGDIVAYFSGIPVDVIVC